MIKLLVLLFFLILSGSTQKSLSNADTEKVPKSDDRSSYPCFSQFSETASREKQLPNEEQSSQHKSNEENKEDKVQIVIDCLVKINSENAIESVTETVKSLNLTSRRSPDNKNQTETKDNFRDFTSKRNRSKINEEPTIYLDITEKCMKDEKKAQKKIFDSGRRFNNIPYIDNIHETNQSSVNFNSSSTPSNLNHIPKMGPNSTNNQSTILMKVDQALSSNKVSYDTTISPNDYDQILNNKVTDTHSTQKNYSSTSHYDKKISKDMLVHLNLGNKEVTKKPSEKKFNVLSALNVSDISNKIDNKVNINEFSNKPSTKEHDSTFTSTGDSNDDSFVLLDFSNKEIGDEPSIIKYDLKSIFKNKSLEVPFKDQEVKVVPYIQSYEKTYIPHNGDSNKVTSNKLSPQMHDRKSVQENIMITEQANNLYDGTTVPLTNNKDKTATLNNNNNNELFIKYDLSNTSTNDKVTKLFVDNRRKLKDSDKNLTYKHEQTFVPSDNNSADAKKNQSFIDRHRDLAQKDDFGKKTTNRYKQTTTPSNGNFKDLFLHYDLDKNALHDDYKADGNTFSTNKYARVSTRNDEDFKNIFLTNNITDKYLSHKDNDDKHTTNRSEKPITANDDFFNDLFLFLSLGNMALRDNNTKVFKDYDQKGVDKLSSDKKNNTKSLTQMFKEHRKDLDYNEPSIEKYDSSTMLKDDIKLGNLGNNTFHQKNSSKIYDLESVLINNNNYDEHDSTYDQSYGIKHNIKTNLGDISNKEVENKSSNKKYDLKFTVNDEVSKENDTKVDDKDMNGLYAINGSNFYETPEVELRTTLDAREPYLVEPTTGYSIKDLFKARVMLLQSTRVCYACSSISDHSCWQPTRSTTVKYCRKGHNACMTKTFKTEESEFIVIRDCGTICDGTWPVLDAKYKSCSICNQDMCNDKVIDINSGHINSINLLYFVSITVIVNFMV